MKDFIEGVGAVVGMIFVLCFSIFICVMIVYGFIKLGSYLIGG